MSECDARLFADEGRTIHTILRWNEKRINPALGHRSLITRPLNYGKIGTFSAFNISYKIKITHF